MDISNIRQFTNLLDINDSHDTPNTSVNPFMHNVVKWPNILSNSCALHAARFLKYASPFYNIMHESVNIPIQDSSKLLTVKSKQKIRKPKIQIKIFLNSISSFSKKRVADWKTLEETNRNVETKTKNN